MPLLRPQHGGDALGHHGVRQRVGGVTLENRAQLQALGVTTLIVTDISRDGAMQGANLALYRDLAARFSLNITASGGVSSLEDVKRLAGIGLYGAIIGKAYYTGALNLREAIEAAT